MTASVQDRRGGTAQTAIIMAVGRLHPDAQEEISELTKNKIDYFVVCVNDFADTHGMSYTAAFDYLKAYKGLDFLSNHYDIEHTYSIEDAVADLAQVCARNGGVAA